MGKTEKLLGGLIIILMIIRLIFYISFLDTIIILLTLILALIYFGLSFALLNNIRLRNISKKNSYQNIGILRIIGAIGTGIVLSMICIYILFKFMGWPFANSGLLTSLIPLLIPIIIVTVKVIITKSRFYLNFLIRLLIFAVIGTSFYFISTEKIFEMKNRNFPEYIEAKKKSMQDPQNKELQQKVIDERKKMNLTN